MLKKTICKTIHQYNKAPVLEADMKKLQAVALDYAKVKNYVYQRYGGITGLSKIYPGYTVQNEMMRSGLREELGLPSVYFYLAVFDALGEIKSQWTRTKSEISNLAGKNESFTEEEKHYLRFILKINNSFEAVLNEKAIVLQKDIQEQYDRLVKEVDRRRLHHYLRRQVRKYHRKPHTDETSGFSISERAYRYADHGIYISTKEKKKRIFIILTDSNQYTSQLYIKLYPEQDRLEIKVPVNVAVKKHGDYVNQVGLSVGMLTMLTTDQGHKYGEELGAYQEEYTDWIRKQAGNHKHSGDKNSGRKKYKNKKKQYEEQLHSYINHELNRFLQTEKPKIIYIPKLPRPQSGGVNKKINHVAALWQRGYIRRRLYQKCMEQSVDVEEVFAKDISRECSRCSTSGTKQNGMFLCSVCGYKVEEKINAAQNAKKRSAKSTAGK